MSIHELWFITTPDGKFFPYVKGRGGTFTNPVSSGHPRVFYSLRSAQNFLKMWRKGECRRARIAPNNPFEDGPAEFVDFKEIPGRKEMIFLITACTVEI